MKKKTIDKMNKLMLLVRTTTWKCGKLQKQIISFLRQKSNGTAKTKEVFHFVLKSPWRRNIQHKSHLVSAFFEAVQRLERRHIVKVK